MGQEASGVRVPLSSVSEVRPSSCGLGQGLFATCDIEPGWILTNCVIEERSLGTFMNDRDLTYPTDFSVDQLTICFSN